MEDTKTKKRRWASLIIATLFLFVGILWSFLAFQGIDRDFINTLLIPGIFVFLSFVLFNLPSREENSRSWSINKVAITLLASTVIAFVMFLLEGPYGTGWSTLITLPLVGIFFLILIIQIILHYFDIFEDERRERNNRLKD